MSSSHSEFICSLSVNPAPLFTDCNTPSVVRLTEHFNLGQERRQTPTWAKLDRIIWGKLKNNISNFRQLFIYIIVHTAVYCKNAYRYYIYIFIYIWQPKLLNFPFPRYNGSLSKEKNLRRRQHGSRFGSTFCTHTWQFKQTSVFTQHHIWFCYSDLNRIILIEGLVCERVTYFFLLLSRSE